MSFSQHSMRSPNDKSKGMHSHALARSDKQTHPLGQAPSDFPSLTTDHSKGLLISNDPKLEVSRGSTVTQSPSALHLSRSFRSTGSSSSISYSPSDYMPKHAEQSSSLEHTGSGVGLHSPARPPYAAYSQSLTGQTSSSSNLLQSFSSMHVGDTTPSVQRALFPQEQAGQNAVVRTSCSTSDERSDSTARRIQEAAMNRQDMLSLRPTTNPVGGSMGPAPVLRHMNVSQIAPNRVCCNALLAAYARAKPTLWQKVYHSYVLARSYYLSRACMSSNTEHRIKETLLVLRPGCPVCAIKWHFVVACTLCSVIFRTATMRSFDGCMLSCWCTSCDSDASSGTVALSCCVSKRRLWPSWRSCSQAQGTSGQTQSPTILC